MSDESRVYAFADFFRMKPGTIIGGFAKIADSWRLATKWYLPEGLNKRNIIPFKFVTEHDVNWRRKYRPSSKTYGLTRLYRAPEEDLNIPMPAISIPLEVNLSVGIYLGHILKAGDTHYVNCLTNEGYDVWIEAI